MTTRYLVIFLVFLTSLLGNDSCRVFGDKQNNLSGVIKEKSAILWQLRDDKWRVSLPKASIDLSKQNCTTRDYVLLSNENVLYETPNYEKNSYTIKKGWNYLSSHENGVDVEETFAAHKEIDFVYVYDKVTEAWAGFSADKNLRVLMSTTKIIHLEDIEKNTGFYLYSNKNIKIQIKSKKLNDICKQYIDNSKNAIITDSGTDTAVSYNEDKSMGIKSRYISHYKRGIYSDSRVTLIYPKLNVTSKVRLKYGPAKPKTLMTFAKEYEGTEFYIYSYKDEKCFKGIFPSEMIPPFSGLKELK